MAKKPNKPKTNKGGNMPNVESPLTVEISQSFSGNLSQNQAEQVLDAAKAAFDAKLREFVEVIGEPEGVIRSG
jgi:hypothetical protein